MLARASLKAVSFKIALSKHGSYKFRYKLVKELIDMAKNAGCDAVKFQKCTTAFIKI